MCGPWHQACLDALHDGNQTRTRGKHDERFSIGGQDVPRERHHRDPRIVSESILEFRFRSYDDARDVASVRFSQRKLAGSLDRRIEKDKR